MRLLLSSALLGLAWFAAVNIVGSLVAWGLARVVVGTRVRGGLVPLTVRLLPALASCIFVAAVFLPTHWRFEQADTEESFGVVLGALALLALGPLLRTAWVAVTLGWRDYQRLTLTCRGAVRIDRGVAPREFEAFEVNGLRGVSLAGIFRPAILVGSDARAALTPSELDVAIAHEIAHGRSRDNLKRFLMFCSPDLFRWLPAARRLEEHWQAETECQADASAVRGDEGRAVVLASALVKVARLACRGRAMVPSPAWSAFHVPTLLETRVRRLVTGSIAAPAGAGRLWAAIAAAAVAMPLGVWLMDASYTLHVVTEALVEHLP